MTSGHEDRPAIADFDPDHLKTLPHDELADALFAEAYASVAHVPEDQKETVKDQIDSIHGNVVTEVLEEEIETGADDGSPGPTFDVADLIRRRNNQALFSLSKTRQALEHGLKTGVGYDGTRWTVSDTAFALREMCKDQDTVGIAVAGEFVRETALHELRSYPAYRGAVLLADAHSGDKESLQLGIDAMQEAVDGDHANWHETYDAVYALISSIGEHDPEANQRLRDLAIDMTATLRHWRQDYWAAEPYATAVAYLASSVRDIDHPYK